MNYVATATAPESIAAARGIAAAQAANAAYIQDWLRERAAALTLGDIARARRFGASSPFGLVYALRDSDSAALPHPWCMTVTSIVTTIEVARVTLRALARGKTVSVFAALSRGDDAPLTRSMFYSSDVSDIPASVAGISDVVGWITQADEVIYGHNVAGYARDGRGVVWVYDDDAAGEHATWEPDGSGHVGWRDAAEVPF